MLKWVSSFEHFLNAKDELELQGADKRNKR